MLLWDSLHQGNIRDESSWKGSKFDHQETWLSIPHVTSTLLPMNSPENNFMVLTVRGLFFCQSQIKFFVGLYPIWLAEDMIKRMFFKQEHRDTILLIYVVAPVDGNSLMMFS